MNKQISGDNIVLIMDKEEYRSLFQTLYDLAYHNEAFPADYAEVLVEALDEPNQQPTSNRTANTWTADELEQLRAHYNQHKNTSSIMTMANSWLVAHPGRTHKAIQVAISKIKREMIACQVR